jgi:hypothetical protein
MWSVNWTGGPPSRKRNNKEKKGKNQKKKAQRFACVSSRWTSGRQPSRSPQVGGRQAAVYPSTGFDPSSSAAAITGRMVFSREVRKVTRAVLAEYQRQRWFRGRNSTVLCPV